MQLTELPPALGQLMNLQLLLDLSHNQLTDLPLELGQLYRLLRLDLSTTISPRCRSPWANSVVSIF